MDTKCQSLISIQNLSHTYNRWGTEVLALRDISLDLKRGEWVMLLGSNGAGKSTLLRILGGEIPGKTNGKALLNGKDLLQTRFRDRSRYFANIQQDPRESTVDDLTVTEHFALSAIDHGTWARPVTNSLRKMVSSLLKPYGLDNRIDLPVGLLSGGERQILALLIARLRKVDVLLLDEPIAALDSRNAHVCLTEIKEAVADHITVLMITHDLHIACKYGSRLIGLACGRVVIDLKETEIKQHQPVEIWEILEKESREEI